MLASWADYTFNNWHCLSLGFADAIVAFMSEHLWSFLTSWKDNWSLMTLHIVLIDFNFLDIFPFLAGIIPDSILLLFQGLQVLMIFEWHEIAELTLHHSRSSKTSTLALDLAYYSSTCNLCALNSTICFSFNNLSFLIILSLMMTYWMSAWLSWWCVSRCTWLLILLPWQHPFPSQYLWSNYGFFAWTAAWWHQPCQTIFHLCLAIQLVTKHCTFSAPVSPSWTGLNIPGEVQKTIHCIWFPNQPAIHFASLLF